MKSKILLAVLNCLISIGLMGGAASSQAAINNNPKPQPLPQRQPSPSGLCARATVLEDAAEIFQNGYSEENMTFAKAGAEFRVLGRPLIDALHSFRVEILFLSGFDKSESSDQRGWIEISSANVSPTGGCLSKPAAHETGSGHIENTDFLLADYTQWEPYISLLETDATFDLIAGTPAQTFGGDAYIKIRVVSNPAGGGVSQIGWFKRAYTNFRVDGDTPIEPTPPAPIYSCGGQNWSNTQSFTSGTTTFPIPPGVTSLCIVATESPNSDQGNPASPVPITTKTEILPVNLIDSLVVGVSQANCAVPPFSKGSVTVMDSTGHRILDYMARGCGDGSATIYW